MARDRCWLALRYREQGPNPLALVAQEHDL
jgi:hypothetical protein